MSPTCLDKFETEIREASRENVCPDTETSIPAIDREGFAAQGLDSQRTILSAEEFKAFKAQLASGETDSQLLAARKRLLSKKRVWEG